jgi:riboflavin synthase
MREFDPRVFTGLIEAVGIVQDVVRNRGTPRITVRAPQLATRLKTGDSIAVSGVCLTALELTTATFAADLAAETLARTSLAHLSKGAQVNLELPTRAGAPLGGHVVQGHVDGMARVISLERNPGADDWMLTLELPQEMERYVVEKGSIAIEGISLTIAAIVGSHMKIAIIPHTYSATNLNSVKAGQAVNVELDVLAKYAEKSASATKDGISLEELLRQGF